MLVLQTSQFKKSVKKLHDNQKRALDKAVRTIMENPYIGEEKSGDLAGVMVYKFKMVNQPALLAYTYEKKKMILTLLAIGTHENFYRDLKKS